jgi:putative Mg2+ transporter-C (MgtC) family protein
MGQLGLALAISVVVLVLLLASRPFTEKWDPDSPEGKAETD